MAVDDQQLIGTIRCNQGAAAARRQNWAEAAGYFRAAIEALQAGGHPHSLAEAMIGLGRACHQAGDHDEALRQLRAAQALAAETGNVQRAAEAEVAIAELAGGRRDPGPQRAEPQGAGPQPGNLTGRQAEVLRLLAAGLSNKQIAAELFISTATVERHLATIYRNLGLAGRVEAARFAISHGIADRAPVS
jgi:DNA-binding NarL/FixJ family response regulator